MELSYLILCSTLLYLYGWIDFASVREHYSSLLPLNLTTVHFPIFYWLSTLLSKLAVLQKCSFTWCYMDLFCSSSCLKRKLNIIFNVKAVIQRSMKHQSTETVFSAIWTKLNENLLNAPKLTKPKICEAVVKGRSSNDTFQAHRR